MLASYAFGVISKKLLLRPTSQRFPPMFSSLSFTISGLIFKSLIHFKLIFANGKIGVQFHSFACGYPVFSRSFVEETTLCPLDVLGSLVKY